MAQTKRKRRTKHRGTAAGTIEARGRTGRKPTASETKKSVGGTARERRLSRLDTPPAWRSAINRAAISALLLFVVLAFVLKPKGGVGAAAGLAIVATIFYVPVGYFTDRVLYNRRQRQKAQGK